MVSSTLLLFKHYLLSVDGAKQNHFCLYAENIILYLDINLPVCLLLSFMLEGSLVIMEWLSRCLVFYYDFVQWPLQCIVYRSGFVVIYPTEDYLNETWKN